MNERRRQIVVNKPLQSQIVRTLSFVPLLTLVIAAGAVTLLVGAVIEEANATGADLPSLGRLLFVFLIFIIAAGAAVLAQALRHSHQVAGPQYRLVQSHRRLRSGDLNFEVSLRDGDQLAELAGEFNQTLAWLREVLPSATGETPDADDTNVEQELAEPVESREA